MIITANELNKNGVTREEIIDTLEAAGLGLENHNPNANLTPEQEKAIRDYYGNANHENDDRKPKARTVKKQTEKAEFPILVRISDRNAAQEFDHSKNNYQFDEIIEYLSNNVCQTYSYRVSDTTYCIVVPIEQFDGQVEIFCDYRHYTFDMRVKKRGFTRFVKVIDLPDTEFCKVHFCTFNPSLIPQNYFQHLFCSFVVQSYCISTKVCLRGFN